MHRMQSMIPPGRKIAGDWQQPTLQPATAPFAYPWFMMRPIALALAACLVLVEQSVGAVTVNGYEMHVEERGSGEPLLLLHGFGSSGQAWNPVLEDLSRRYKSVHK